MDQAVSRHGDDFHDRVAAELCERRLQLFDGALQVEGVQFAGDDVEFAL